MVKIITDTTSCLSQDFARQHGIPVIPQVINFGSESYFEGKDLDIQTFLLKLKNLPELPKTAAPPPELFAEVFREFASLNEPILCIHPSAKVSGTVRSATIAAQDFPGVDIRIIDTALIASPLAILVMLASQWAEEGQSVDIIEQQIHRMAARCKIYFLVASLEYLVKGGRIGGAQALLGSLLQIKPILTFKNGQVEPLEKERTYKQAFNRLQELVLSEYPTMEEGYLTVLHAGVPEQGQKLADELRTKLNIENVPIFDMPPAITTHGGPGILGVGFFNLTGG